MFDPLAYTAFSGATTSQASNWLLTSSGVGVDTQTVTIGGVVFTTVTALSVGPAVAGEVVLGVDAAATLTNLTAAINAPGTTTSTFTALSAANAQKIKDFLKLSATTTATVMTMVSAAVPAPAITVSETETNFAWSVNTISKPIPTGMQGKVSIQFIASGISSGNGVFTVQVSNDGSNWVDYNRLTTNATNTNAQTDTRVASVTLSSSTSSMVTFPETDNFVFFRVKVVPTTDGSYSAVAFIA